MSPRIREIEEPGDDSYRQTRDRARYDCAEELAIIDIPAGKRRDCDVGIHPDDLGVDVFFFEKPLGLRRRHGQVRHVRIRCRDAQSIQRESRMR